MGNVLEGGEGEGGVGEAVQNQLRLPQRFNARAHLTRHLARHTLQQAAAAASRSCPRSVIAAAHCTLLREDDGAVECRLRCKRALRAAAWQVQFCVACKM